ncbi:MAG TPA: hypothetical protein VL133_03410, partial [Devosia sp.]|nr:hypothetical protein [Devosia sp.]
MSQLQYYLALVAGGLAAAALVVSLAWPLDMAWLLRAFLVLGTVSLVRLWIPLGFWLDGALALLGAVAVLTGLGIFAPQPPFFWMALVAAWLFSWLFVERLAKAIASGAVSGRLFSLLIPTVFGLAILVVWEVVT